MSTINARISQVVSHSGLTKTQFAKEIHVSQSMVSKLCSGAAMPSDRTISDICRVFAVNELWLRTGEGYMVNIKAENAIIDEIVYTMTQKPKDIEKILRSALVRLPDDALKTILDKYEVAINDIELEEAILAEIEEMPPQD